MASRAGWGPAGRLTSTQAPAPWSAALWAQRPAQGHSTVGQDVTLPSLLQDGAGPWKNTLLFSALWEGLPSQGKLLQERRVITGDMGNHPALGAAPKSHLEETRDQTAQGGNVENPQSCTDWHHHHPPREGFTQSLPETELPEEMIHPHQPPARGRTLRPQLRAFLLGSIHGK